MGCHVLVGRRHNKWSPKDRAPDGVNIKPYSTLKCVYEKLRDAIDFEGGKQNYKITKFVEYKVKLLKRTKTF